MTGQGIWSGTISFSLVAIPVRLVRAVAPGRISFRLLHDTDHSPLARRMFCPGEESMVPPEEIVRGYELAPDRYLPITDEELESVSPERSRTIEILEFIAMDEVDPVYFDRPYYLVPLKGGEKAYRLLAEAMHQTNKAGLAKFVLADREYLVAVTSRQGALALVTLHYGEEVLPDEEIAPKEGKVAREEKSRVRRTVERMMTNFDPGKYADARRERVLDLLKKKAKEEGAVEAPPLESEEEDGAGPPDLMAALEEAMADVQKSR
ncbi:MAG: Ku protein [Deltaproteobacteria bacterium]|nr:Ku protein [Deltaproteobacteria bacterium]